MRKMVFGRHLSRGRKGREALLRSLIKALVIHGEITTTKAKAKAVQKDAEKIVALAKDGSLAARRRVSAILGGDRKLIETVFGQIGKAFAGRAGGFTRIILLPRRKGDAAEMAEIEWSETIKREEPKKAKKEAEKVTKKVEEKPKIKTKKVIKK